MSTKMKSSKKKSVTSKLPPKVTPAPTQGAPSAPAGFDTSQKVPRGSGVPPYFGSLASHVSAELLAAPTFAADFGNKQDPNEIAKSIDVAVAWEKETRAAKGWLTYVAIGLVASYAAARKEVDGFRRAFEYASSLDPTIPTRYPSTEALLRARSAVGARGALTRAKNRAAKAAPAAPPPAIVPKEGTAAASAAAGDVRAAPV